MLVGLHIIQVLSADSSETRPTSTTALSKGCGLGCAPLATSLRRNDRGNDSLVQVMFGSMVPPLELTTAPSDTTDRIFSN
jgi:hypothetical protein